MTIPNDPNGPDPKPKAPWDQLGVGAPYSWAAPSWGAEAARAINTPEALAAFQRLLERQQVTTAGLAQVEAQQRAAEAELARQQQETQRLVAEADAERQRRQDWLTAQEQARQHNEYLVARTTATRATAKVLQGSVSTFVVWAAVGFGGVTLVMLLARVAKKAPKAPRKEESPQ